MGNIEPQLIGWICLAGLFIMLALRIPVAISLGFIGFLGYWAISGQEPAFFIAGAIPYARVAIYNWSVVPLFIIMGHFAFQAGFISDVFNTFRQWLGWLPGGLVHATIAGAAAFGAACGSSVAACAMVGRTTMPEMLKHGVDRKLAMGAVAASGTIAMMIPPSNLMVFYGIITEQSISKLLIAGIIPGIVAAIIYMIQVFIRVKLDPSLAPPLKEKYSWKSKLISLKGVWGISLIAIIIMGGLYSGVFTPTEAGAIGAFTTFILALSMRRLSWSFLYNALLDTIRTTGFLFLILGLSAFFGYLLAITRLPAQISEFLAGLEVNRYVILMGMILLYVVLGTFLDSISQMILTLPIIFPAVVALDFPIIWFGVFLVHLMEMGMITPPFALNVFVLKGVVEDTTSSEVIRAVIPYMLADWITLAVYILFPALALWLPSMMN